MATVGPDAISPRVASEARASPTRSTAREAMACGCPVVAFPGGALADIVDTGDLASSAAEMAEAIPACAAINREAAAKPPTPASPSTRPSPGTSLSTNGSRSQGVRS